MHSSNGIFHRWGDPTQFLESGKTVGLQQFQIAGRKTETSHYRSILFVNPAIATDLSSPILAKS